ncbi:MAG TPA: hypothetical protein VMX55_06045 [candidate division Zixibacteria bacterium]|nr:hypothetical protein [candidate division Zixibacteria bacterium]
MIRSRTPKEEEISEENLVGKSIVDPNGDIIAKCVEVFEDDKKKLRMRISIKTEFNSDFIVDETIPINMINKIGEVILLKRSFEIKEISSEDLITFEIPKENDLITTQIEDMKIEDESSESEAKLHKNDNDKNQMKNVEDKNAKKNIQNTSEKSEKKQTNIKIGTTAKKSSQKKLLDFNHEFSTIIEEKNPDNRLALIDNFVDSFFNSRNFSEIVLSNLFQITTDTDTRALTAEIFERIISKSRTIKEIAPIFQEVLKATYNEPSKHIEQKLTNSLNKIATTQNDELLSYNLSNFFIDLLIKRKYCKNITINRIHNINLKIFANNFHVQAILVKTYLVEMIKNSLDAKEYATLLRDYNAIIIAYTLIQEFDPNIWQTQISVNKFIQESYDSTFIESVNNILENFTDGNLKKLNEIFDLKLGIYFTNRIIAKMIKTGLKDLLSNVSILPLEVLSSFYGDNEYRIVQIIFDLINKQEIEAQITFIEDKTYISLR